MNDRITVYGLDASGAQCPEGYYVTDGRTLYQMPPTGECWSSPDTADGKHRWCRPATQDEVDRLGPAAPASAELIANCDPAPSDRKA